jgi:hypothetical protein
MCIIAVIERLGKPDREEEERDTCIHPKEKCVCI